MKTDCVVLRNALLRGREGLWSIIVDEGRITKISRSAELAGAKLLDARGGLTTESFVIAHLHLDKVRTADWVPVHSLRAYQEGLMDTRRSIALAAEAKRKYHRKEIVSRARKMVEEALRNGVTHIRAFADVDTRAKLEAVKALIDLRESFNGRVDLQVVAFPQEGIEADPGAEEYVAKAMEAGADVVGGIPWLESSREKQEKHIDKMFSIARRFNRPIAMLVDDQGDPGLRTLEMLARKTLSERWMGRVQACHARAMQLYPPKYAKRVAEICSRAGIGLVSSPHTGPFHVPFDLLRRVGVTVALGQDDCSDAYYPYGRCNMLEVAFLASHILRKMSPTDAEELYDMVTVSPARIMGVLDFGLREGAPANLVVLRQKRLVQAIAYHSEPLFVISHGRLRRA